MTTAKELFFDPYNKNKATGSFILIDPITNNTSAVGMIIGKLDGEIAEELIPTVNLKSLGVDESHREAIMTVAKELDRQGFAIKVI